MKKKKGALLVLLLLLLVFILLFAVKCAKDSESPKDPGTVGNQDPGDKEALKFADPVFEELLKAELGKEEIYPADLAGISGVRIAADKFMFLSGKGRPSKSIILYEKDTFEYEGQKYTGYGTMKSLEDLQYFPDLTALHVTLQPGVDYSTIPEDLKLGQLTITQSQLTDLGFLQKVPGLVSLNLNTNDIGDISILKELPELKYLSLNFNQISDLQALVELLKLEELTAYDNQIVDITPLAELKNLTEIGFYNNAIKDITVLQGLTNLKTVELINNQIEDVSPLKDFTAFERLALTGNPVTNIELLDHIANLEF